MRTTLLVFHVLGAATWLGANITQAVASPQFIQAGGEAAARWWRTTVYMGRVLYPSAAIVILLSGIFLVITSEGGYQFSDGFVSVGFAMIVIGIVIGITIFRTRGAKAAELREAGDAAAAAGPEATIRNFGILDTVLLIITIVAMVSRWGI
jgi:hypothetical protein